MYPQGVCRIRKSASPTTAALYFKIPYCRIGAKDPLIPRQDISRECPTKKGAGRIFSIHPAVAPVSLLRDYSVCVFTHGPAHLGGQNLAALCTTAGQNLTAVGSSHSLTETVNLGTMTAAGLVGTLHYTFTSCGCFVSYARQSERPQQHIINDHTWSC